MGTQVANLLIIVGDPVGNLMIRLIIHRFSVKGNAVA